MFVCEDGRGDVYSRGSGRVSHSSLLLIHKWYLTREVGYRGYTLSVVDVLLIPNTHSQELVDVDKTC